MPEGITGLSRLTMLNVGQPFGPRGRLPPGICTMPLETLLLYGASLYDDDALRELGSLTRLQVCLSPSHALFSKTLCPDMRSESFGKRTGGAECGSRQGVKDDCYAKHCVAVHWGL